MSKKFFRVSAKSFSKIPGSPIAYWVSKALRAAYDGKTLMSLTVGSVGIQTGDNDSFVHLWWEVNRKFICTDARNLRDSFKEGCNWFPYNKGGEYRKWAGNDYHIVFWHNDGERVKESSATTGRHYQQYSDQLKFQPLITWSRITSGSASFRFKDYGTLSDMAGFSLYSKGGDLNLVLALCNSVVAAAYFDIIAPTLNLMVGQVLTLPFQEDVERSNSIGALSTECVQIVRADWDSFEISWDFKCHPLVKLVRN